MKYCTMVDHLIYLPFMKTFLHRTIIYEILFIVYFMYFTWLWKESLNTVTDDQQFHHYQQNEHSFTDLALFYGKCLYNYVLSDNLSRDIILLYSNCKMKNTKQI